MISKLDRSCNWDNKNRPAIATRINSLSSLLLEKIRFPTKQWFADNLRHLPLPPGKPGLRWSQVHTQNYSCHFWKVSISMATRGSLWQAQIQLTHEKSFLYLFG